ncbi:unnamed protein product [Didymodactylos carnosus]|uniref:Ubiquitin-like domain-containing protein n=1 Tax=Didymodactylos carnosus TaxID=1234261 RepID=A0A815PL46_9BILA|nr:unnamed protein product [Didymodactylos carnosus]CAF1450162.1 unnamed protein product [Didymodactylos carnosus]CAF4070888.1 unnamed protein product [Didymodactylos carnosus]CAF4323709.1 unnamed protein product [Didymodactylos carnosus]
MTMQQPSLATQDVHLMIRRAKVTIFTDVAETSTVLEVKKVIATILKIDPLDVHLVYNDQPMEDIKRLHECGISSKDARPQTPAQIALSIRNPDSNEFDKDDIIPYSSNTSDNTTQSSMIQQQDSR